MYPFQFDKSIDAEYLFAMYENDYGYIEQIFNLTLSTFSEDISIVDKKFGSDDVEGVRKAIHKIKSAFGFIGMIEIQQICQTMEDRCCSTQSFDEIKPELEKLIKQITIHNLILRNESVRLKNFNSQTS